MEAPLISNSRSPTISVVVPTLNEMQYLAATLTQLHATLPRDSEVVVVDDGSTDGSDAITKEFVPRGVRLLRTYNLGAAGARNHGARRTTGDVIVFADAHVDVPSGWYEPLIDVLHQTGVGGVAPAVASMGRPDQKGFGYCLTGPTLDTAWLGQQATHAYPVPLLSSCFMALRRDVFEQVGGFDGSMVRWGMEDTELSLRLWLMGYTLMVVPQVEVAHLFRESHPYSVDWTTVLYNSLRMVFAHFSPRRIARVIGMLKQHSNFADALALCMDSDIWTKRAQLAARRVHHDDWYFERFGIAI
jgi:GT2 family glycosyltransferase